METTPKGSEAKRENGTRPDGGHFEPGLLNGLEQWKLFNRLDETALKNAREVIENNIRTDNPAAASIKADETQAWNRVRFLFALEQSVRHLPNYATLDHHHITEVLDVKQRIADYIKDGGRSRPINFMIVASAGEGKSHFVKCLAESDELKDRTRMVSFNMATMQNLEDLVAALDRARNARIESDKIPMLFLDEFDTERGKYFSCLLPLLWDGEIVLGDRDIKLGRAVIVLAGSDSNVAKAALDRHSTTDDGRLSNKTPDLLSRINGGVIFIPSMKPEGGNQTDRSVDKVCIAIAQLRKSYDGGGLIWVPASLLHFIYKSKFEYGSRSISHLLGLLPTTKIPSKEDPKNSVFEMIDEHQLNIDTLSAILDKPEKIKECGLDKHVDHHGGQKGISEDWSHSKQIRHLVPIWCDSFRKDQANRPATWKETDASWKVATMFDELMGEKQEDRRAGGSTVAGIEPFLLTRLWINESEGRWDHGEPGMRHVFFSLKTLRHIFNAANKGPGSLSELGHNMGESFGREFVDYLKKKGPLGSNLDQVIWYWCKFDVSGGWGTLDHRRDSQMLTVANSFLVEMSRVSGEAGNTAEGTHSGTHFCDLMTGYIQGVLEKLKDAVHPNESSAVEVREVECAAKGAAKCVFRW